MGLRRIYSRWFRRTDRAAFETALARAFEGMVRHYVLDLPHWLPHAIGAANHMIVILREEGIDPWPFLDPAMRPLMVRPGSIDCDSEDTVEMIRTVNQLLKLRSAQGSVQ